MKKIYLLVTIFVIIIVALVVYEKMGRGPLAPISYDSSLGYKNSANDICVRYPETYNIQDNKNEMVVNLTDNFISRHNLSREYFENNFTFDCGSEKQSSAYYNFTVGDYSVRISLSNNPGDISYYDGLHEITSVIPKEDAYKKLEACLSGTPEGTELQLYKGELKMLATRNGVLGLLNLETGECSTEYYKK